MWTGALSIILSTLGICFLKVVRGRKKVGYASGWIVPFAPMSLLGAILPTSWFNPGLDWSWHWRRSAFYNHSAPLFSIIPFLFGDAALYTNSLEITRQVLSRESKLHLSKPSELMQALLLWGDNVVSASGETWKRHRRIVGPAFTPKTYQLVCQETAKLYREMMASPSFLGHEEIYIQDFNAYTQRFALIIISRCGFGLHMPWTEPRNDEPEHMSFAEALEIVSHTHIARLVIPMWAYRLPFRRIKRMGLAWTTLARMMDDLVKERREALSLKPLSTESYDEGDIFSRLVAAQEEEGGLALTPQEVIGNTFTLLFAGHETTAKVLTATLGYLAFHDNYQTMAFDEITSIIPPAEIPSQEQLLKLKLVWSCFLEALRIFPAGVLLIRDFPGSFPVTGENLVTEPTTLQAGTRLFIDMVAIHHNRYTFPDPENFLPSRWDGVSEHDVSMFGIGPRACLGRKFAQLEALCFLAMFLREWKVEMKLETGETGLEWLERVMEGGLDGLAFGVKKMPLIIRRRSHVDI